jgi:hypothetical protein
MEASLVANLGTSLAADKAKSSQTRETTARSRVSRRSAFPVPGDMKGDDGFKRVNKIIKSGYSTIFDKSTFFRDIAKAQLRHGLCVNAL